MFHMSVAYSEEKKYYYSRESFTRYRENTQNLTRCKVPNLDKYAQNGIWDLVWIRLRSRPFTAVSPFPLFVVSVTGTNK